MKNKKAQSLVEYALIAGIIAIVLATMGAGFKRTIQKIVKSTADAIGFQSESEQAFNPDDGFLNSAETDVNATVDTFIDETQGSYSSVVEETIKVRTTALTNMGFTEHSD